CAMLAALLLLLAGLRAAPAEDGPLSPAAAPAPLAAPAAPPAPPAELRLGKGNGANPHRVTDALSGEVSVALARPLTVRAEDAAGRPGAGVPVLCTLAAAPDGARGAELTGLASLTDADGAASAGFRVGSEPGIYLITATVPGRVLPPLSFKVLGLQHLWWLYMLFGAFGGLGLFIYGMQRASDALQKATGDRLKDLLAMFTDNRLLGVAVGAAMTAIVQSSTATTVMLVSFANAGLLTLLQSLGVILGADIGTTITVQLIAFKLSDYALLMIGVGFLFLWMGKRSSTRYLGQVVMGFGLVFFGIKILAEIMSPLRANADFLDLMLHLENPFWALFIGFLFAVILHSGPTMGIIIALAMQGLLSLRTAIPMIYGANVGTCIMALAAGVGANAEAKRVGMAHFLFKVLGVLLFWPFLDSFCALVASISPGPRPGLDPLAMSTLAEISPRQIANAHSAFNVLLTLLFLPFLGPFARLLERIVPGSVAQKRFGPEFILPQYLKVTALAVQLAHREVVRMAEVTRGLVARCMEVFLAQDAQVLEALRLEDDKVDILRHAITRYLTSLTESELTPEQGRRSIQILRTVQKIEDIGDLVSREIIHLGRKMISENIRFSPEGMAQLIEYHANVLKSYDAGIEAIRSDDPAQAKRLTEQKIQFVEQEKEFHRAHIDRLRRGLVETQESSNIHLDLLTNLRRINSHVVDIAYSILDEHSA
ncbi:MAG: Na/Pi symporter, partial [Planctomycetes bacterium]|nr:Na/Pi symporter [Planctomycetota bacterium]